MDAIQFIACLPPRLQLSVNPYGKSAAVKRLRENSTRPICCQVCGLSGGNCLEDEDAGLAADLAEYADDAAEIIVTAHQVHICIERYGSLVRHDVGALGHHHAVPCPQEDVPFRGLSGGAAKECEVLTPADSFNGVEGKSSLL